MTKDYLNLEGLSLFLEKLSSKFSGIDAKTTVTLSASSWVGTEAPFTYAVTVSGHDNTTDLVELMAGDGMSADQVTALQDANIVTAEWTANTTLTLYAYGVKPEIDAPIKIIVRGDI